MTSGVRKSDIWNNSGRPNQYRPNLADPAQGATTILGATGPVEAKKWARTSHTQPVFFSSKPDTLLSTFRLPFAIFTKFGKDTRTPPQRKIFKNIFLQCSSVDMFHRTAFVKIFRLGITSPLPKNSAVRQTGTLYSDQPTAQGRHCKEICSVRVVVQGRATEFPSLISFFI